MAGDAHDEDAKQQRRDDDFDEPQENGAEKLQFYGESGPIMAQAGASE